MPTIPSSLSRLLVVLVFASGALFACAQSQPQLPKVQAGYYRLALGGFTVTALSDGSSPLPVGPLMLHAAPARVQQLLARQYLSDTVATSINIYLIDTGTKRLLVDAGAGPFFGPAGGHLLTSLRAAGYQPEQIDAVLLTHLHSDHAGGLSQGGQPTFPNATVYVAQAEADFWLTPANRAKVAAANRHQFEDAAAALRPVQAAGKLKPFRGNTELFPGVRPMAIPGHTPGHTGYVVESQGQQLFLWGDVLHVGAVQFPDPAIAVTTDENPDTATAQRQRALADAGKRGTLFASSHLSFPGIGHVRAEGQEYRWVPLNFSYTPKH